MARSEELIALKDHIEHFGVKGMKWGVRKKRTYGSSARQSYRAGVRLGNAGLLQGKVEGARPAARVGIAVGKANRQLTIGGVAALRAVAKAWQERGGGAEVREVNKLRRKLRMRGASKLSNDDLQKLQTRLSAEVSVYNYSKVTGDTRYKLPDLNKLSNLK